MWGRVKTTQFPSEIKWYLRILLKYLSACVNEKVHQQISNSDAINSHFIKVFFILFSLSATVKILS